MLGWQASCDRVATFVRFAEFGPTHDRWNAEGRAGDPLGNRLNGNGRRALVPAGSVMLRVLLESCTGQHAARPRRWGDLRQHGMTVSRDSFRVPARCLGAMWLVGVLGAGVLAGSAQAETLREALNAAYKFNPRLDAARATQRATDEEVPRALSGYRPSITGSADTNYQLQTTQPSGGRGASPRRANRAATRWGRYSRCSAASAPRTRCRRRRPACVRARRPCARPKARCCWRR